MPYNYMKSHMTIPVDFVGLLLQIRMDILF